MKNNVINALYIALGYTIIIGFFMYLMHHVAGYTYGEPDMVNILVVFEVQSAIALLWLTYTYDLWEEIGLVNLKQTEWKYAIAILILPLFWLGALLFGIFENLAFFKQNLFSVLILVFTLFLVGLTEEIVFRGFVFNNLKKHFPLWIAILLGAISFSLLHAVNVWGGNTIEMMKMQLLDTFIAGIFFCLVFLKTKNLWIAIFFHFIWDLYLLMGQSYLSVDVFSIVTTLGVYFEYISIIVLLFLSRSILLKRV